ncbi:MAG: KEOPS complex subunit Pcc1 [Candidatus Thorarchaeota archaeon]
MESRGIENVHAVLHIDLDSPELVDILYQALEPETASVPSDRASVKLEKLGSRLIVTIDANDLTALRASMNSYLAWISGSIRTVDSVTGQNP